MVKRKEISAMLLLFQNNAIMPMMPSWRLSLPAAPSVGFYLNVNSPDYFFQASMMPLKPAAFREAPPIKPPSMSGFAKSSGALLGLQLPP